MVDEGNKYSVAFVCATTAVGVGGGGGGSGSGSGGADERKKGWPPG